MADASCSQSRCKIVIVFYLSPWRRGDSKLHLETIRSNHNETIIINPLDHFSTSLIGHHSAPALIKNARPSGWDGQGVLHFGLLFAESRVWFFFLLSWSNAQATVAARGAPQRAQGMAAVKRNWSLLSQCPTALLHFELPDFCCCWWGLKIKCNVQQQMLVLWIPFYTWFGCAPGAKNFGCR